MKRFVYKLPTELFEIFAVELNGYGFEILERNEKETIFAIYVEESEEQALKDAVNEIFKDLGAGELLKEELIPEENWTDKWKEDIKPIEVSPFIILPEWEIYEGDKLIPIKIRIGMAFGTGLHATTQMVLKLLPKYISKGDTVLDVGTGTGILAIASAKLGASKVKGIDIDETAVEECKVNCWENEEENIECVKAIPKDIKEKFDIVLANLEMKIFRETFKDIIKLFNKYLIISGIFKPTEKEEILKMAKESNLKVVDELSKPEDEEKPNDIWFAFVLKYDDD
ncbi:MAG: 50S ribosomal protein L11 methyltransferase [Persephonella sp.]|nr:MAG: 50S ribosomal protein L11 methyltransferase [Persephonella sp.]